MAETSVTQISEKEISSILAGNVESVLIPEEEKVEDKVEDVKIEDKKVDTGFKKPIDNDFKWSDLEPTEAVETEEVVENGVKKTIEVKKPTEFLSVINDLITDGDLVGFEEGDIKSLDEAKELIRLNVQEAKKSGFEDVWKDKVESFSPQVQAILKYAETGGQDILPLLNAISKVEEVSNFDIDTEEGQEEIIKQYLKVQGWEEDDILEDIETAKDNDKLKAKAEKWLPKLNQMHQQRVDQMMAEQEEADKEAMEARQNYLNTIRTTLSKEKLTDVKLAKEDKAMLWDSLTDIKYKS